MAIRTVLQRVFNALQRGANPSQEWTLLSGGESVARNTHSFSNAISTLPKLESWHDDTRKDSWAKRFLREELEFGHGFLFVPVLLGLGAAIWFSLEEDPTLPTFWIAAAFLFAAILLWRFGKATAAVSALFPALLAGGMLSAQMESDRLKTVVLDSPVTTTITGVVERREATGEQRWRYFVRLTDTAAPKLKRAPQHVTLVVRGKGSAFETNSVVQGRVRLNPPSGPALPGLSDFSFTAYFEGTGATGYFYGKPQLIGSEQTSGLGEHLILAAYALRSYVGDRIRKLIPGDEGAFAAAIVTDERRAISPQVVEALRLSGLAHIVAISGLNMALAAGIFFVGLRSVLVLIPGVSARLPVKKIAAFAALLMVTAYYGISGFGVSAERAYIMMAIMLLAILFNRPSLSMHNIALAALTIILLHPSSVMGASFQMSFAATAALLVCYRLWSDRAQEDLASASMTGLSFTGILSAFGRLIGGILLTSLVGGLATAVFSIAHFNQLTAYGLAANLATMPIISFIVMPFGLVGMLLMPLGLDEPFFTVMAAGLRLVIAVAIEVASWGGNVQTGRSAEWFLPVATTGLVLFVLLRTHIRWLGLAIVVGATSLNSLTERSRPDIVIGEDGRLVAVVAGTTATVNLLKPSDFIFKQWKNGLGIEEVLPPEITRVAMSGKPDKTASNGLSSTSQGEDAPRAARTPLTGSEIAAIDLALNTRVKKEGTSSRFRCVESAICITKTNPGVIVAVVIDTRLTGFACDRANLVIVAGSPFNHCRSGALLLTGEKLTQTGTVEIKFNGSADPKAWRLRSAFESAERPWQIHRIYDWRTNAFEPIKDDLLTQIRDQ